MAGRSGVSSLDDARHRPAGPRRANHTGAGPPCRPSGPLQVAGLHGVPAFEKTWLRITKTAAKKAAAVAIARKLLVLMWTLERKDEPYKSREPVAA
jgi:hypothetical protein